MINVIYKQKDGIIHNKKTVPEHFTGYKITKDHNTLSTICEYNKGQMLSTIKYRPTKKPIIFSLSHCCYNETRYNNGNISLIYYTDHNLQTFGELRKYNINGDINCIKYYYDGTDVTDDMKKYLQYTDCDNSFIHYQFKEDELFNIYMLYGSKFKFYNEYKMDSKYFDEVTAFCLD